MIGSGNQASPKNSAATSRSEAKETSPSSCNSSSPRGDVEQAIKALERDADDVQRAMVRYCAGLDHWDDMPVVVEGWLRVFERLQEQIAVRQSEGQRIWDCRVCGFGVREGAGLNWIRDHGEHYNAVSDWVPNRGTAYCPVCSDETLRMPPIAAVRQSEALKLQEHIEALTKAALFCHICGKPAICIANYEAMDHYEPTCDSCCGHGNEDGWCRPIPEAVKALSQWLLEANTRAESEAQTLQQEQEQKNDQGAGLIHQTIPDMAGTEPRLNKEMCICAAVQLPDGRVVAGYRHHHAIETVARGGFAERVPQLWQGFLTTRGRFVDRAEGLALQEAAGIASARGSYNGRALFSEDLY